MSSKSKSGWTEEERYRFMREHGFVQARHAKGGSHMMWEHPVLKELAEKHDIAIPANLLETPGQAAWERPLCDNPAGGTWRNIQKQVLWCAAKVRALQEGEEEKKKKHSLKAHFRFARREICLWKKAQKNWLKAGLPVESIPHAPESYHSYDALLSKTQNFFKRMTPKT